MSNLSQLTQPNQPQDIETLRAELLEQIDERLERLSTQDYSFELPVTNLDQIGILDDVKAYFENGEYMSAVKEFHGIVIEFLTEFRDFVLKTTDIAILENYKNFISSFTLNFRRLDELKIQTMQQAQDARDAGERLDVQNDMRLREDIADITARRANLRELLLLLKGDPDKNAEMPSLILEAINGFPTEPEGLIQVYEKFKSRLKELGSDTDPVAAAHLITQFLVAMKYVADHSTNQYVSDAISNVYNILFTYFTAVEIGWMYSSEQ